MNQEQLNIVMAVLILALSVPVLFLARAAVRRKSERRMAALARGLGMSEVPPEDERFVFLGTSGASTLRLSAVERVRAIGGAYEGREVVLAEVQDHRPARDPTQAAAPPGRDPSGDEGQSRAGLVRRPRRAGQFVILFVEPMRGLPDFRITAGGPEAPDGRRPVAVGSPAGRPEGEREGPLRIVPESAGEELPGAFLERAARVLAGRPQPWLVEGSAGRLLVRIVGWRPPARVGGFRAILDDALSLREALDDRPEGPGEPGDRGSIRTALERIREASGPLDEEAHRGGPTGG